MRHRNPALLAALAAAVIAPVRSPGRRDSPEPLIDLEQPATTEEAADSRRSKRW